MDSRPIGIFDSGFGGLSITRHIVDLLPHENIVYFGDSARYPYGPKHPLDVRAFAEQITEYLVSNHDVKMLVVACNTASAVALESLQKELDIPVVGVVEPGMRAALQVTVNNRVGVIGTTGTIASGVFQQLGTQLSVDSEIYALACPGFVEFVESGNVEGEEIEILCQRLLNPLVDANVDTLLLACTHYPFIARPISAALGPDVMLVAASEQTAFEVRDLLSDESLANDPLAVGNHQFFTSGDVEWFREHGSTLFVGELSVVGSVKWQ